MTKLEDAMAGMCATTEDLETLLYKIGDSPTPATEDQLMNMLIGIIDMNKNRGKREAPASETATGQLHRRAFPFDGCVHTF